MRERTGNHTFVGVRRHFAPADLQPRRRRIDRQARNLPGDEAERRPIGRLRNPGGLLERTAQLPVAEFLGVGDRHGGAIGVYADATNVPHSPARLQEHTRGDARRARTRKARARHIRRDRALAVDGARWILEAVGIERPAQAVRQLLRVVADDVGHVAGHDLLALGIVLLGEARLVLLDARHADAPPRPCATRQRIESRVVAGRGEMQLAALDHAGIGLVERARLGQHADDARNRNPIARRQDIDRGMAQHELVRGVVAEIALRLDEQDHCVRIRIQYRSARAGAVRVLVARIVARIPDRLQRRMVVAGAVLTRE
jgi:hypothetical protein